jgi:hypothetical protein
MNSRQRRHEVRLRGLVRCGGVPRGAVKFKQVKPPAVWEAFRCRCGEFTRSGWMLDDSLSPQSAITYARRGTGLAKSGGPER